MSGTSYLTGLVKHSRLPINRRSTFRGETGGAETGQSPLTGQASPFSQASQRSNESLSPRSRPIESLSSKSKPIEDLGSRSRPIEDQTFNPDSPIPQASKPRLNPSQRHGGQDLPKQNDVGGGVESHTQTPRVDAQNVHELESRKKRNSDASSFVKALESIKTSDDQLAEFDGKNTIEDGPDIEGKASPVPPKLSGDEKSSEIARQTIKEKLQGKSNAVSHQGEISAHKNQRKKSVSAQQVRLQQARRSELRAMQADPTAKYKRKNNGVHIGTVNVTVSAPPKTPPPAPIINRISKPAPKALPELNRSYQRRF